MASPIQKIRDGLTNGDLEQIAEGYKLLTGEDVPVGIGQVLTRESVIECINSLYDMKENYNGTPQKIVKEPKKSKKEVVPQRSVYGNESIPVTEEAKASEIEKNKKNTISKPKRKPKQVFTTKCSICSNDFESNIEPTSSMGQRCKVCLTKAINGKE